MFALASTDLRAAEAAREMAWEQLHSGPWDSVVPAWRDAYAMACLHVAKFHYANREFVEALRVLDMGMIMGGNTLREDLDSAIQMVSDKARGGGVVEGNGKFERQIAAEKLDLAEVRFVFLILCFCCSDLNAEL